MLYLLSSEAVQLSNKIVVPAEAISVSITEPCCDMSQNSNEVIKASGTQTTGKTGPSTKGMLLTVIHPEFRLYFFLFVWSFTIPFSLCEDIAIFIVWI